MTNACHPGYARHCFPAEVIGYSVRLYFRFPLSLRIKEMLAARGTVVSHGTVRQWAAKFGQSFAHQIRKRLPAPRDGWHLDKVLVSIAGCNHWLWRTVDQRGIVLDILVQSHRNAEAAKRLSRKLFKSQRAVPRMRIIDKLASYGAAKGDIAECRTPPAWRFGWPRREQSPAHPTARADHERLQVSREAQRFLSVHAQAANHFRRPANTNGPSTEGLEQAFMTWAIVTGSSGWVLIRQPTADGPISIQQK